MGEKIRGRGTGHEPPSRPVRGISQGRLQGKALRRGAVIIQLVIATRLQEVIDCLDADKIASATDVLAAVAQVADRRSDEIPLVKTGQGDTERMVYERDLIGEVNKLSAMRKLTDMWRQRKWGTK